MFDLSGALNLMENGDDVSSGQAELSLPNGTNGIFTGHITFEILLYNGNKNCEANQPFGHSSNFFITDHTKVFQKEGTAYF
jgi:hypothetical protein